MNLVRTPAACKNLDQQTVDKIKHHVRGSRVIICIIVQYFKVLILCICVCFLCFAVAS